MDTKQFLARLSRRATLDYKETQQMVGAFTAALVETLSEGDALAVPGFGTFATNKEDEKIVVDRVSGHRILLPPCISVTFTSGTSLDRKVKALWTKQ